MPAFRSPSAMLKHYRTQYGRVTRTTIPIDPETRERLRLLKQDLTFDEVIRLMLDVLDPADLASARVARQEGAGRR